MAKPPSLRLFYAVWPDQTDRAAVRALQLSLPLGGRPVPPENLHITLAFLGEQEQDRLPVLKEILQHLPLPAWRLKLDMLGYFKGSRINWLGMREPPESLMELQSALRMALLNEGIHYAGSERFVPHVTLARNGPPLPPRSIKALFWESAQLVLVRSVLDPAGSHYEVIASC